MRSFLIFWAGPLSFLWGWYFLSYYDLSMGMYFFSREMHDLVFTIYGNILGIAPDSIPPLVARACIVDTGLVFCLIAFRRRKQIIAWGKVWRANRAAAAASANTALAYSKELPSAF
ncbi:DUF6105 family protein [Phyllobacterium myrsinacearum]|uniref:Uncharacterized protein n=1 Tax=Phyllobacterium myrsinacearum TaxID=28101 RepID=A0A2S9JZM8_9HYPH|nr:DUF6105 family protein [Phyllobacterium myrsinacearum]PRD58791.1 hypothetical protein C5750_06870 [Phyllobacterium myrsinacearum]PWV97075.1 hypothetical protein DEV92_1011068 [Phyllobacterium myrsinacearum]RZV08934.1 hypothetical protein EV654_0016 [Phyllobacterium myrsinacearum]